MTPDITVILASYNRAQDLTRTLEGMVRTEKKDLSVEFVVVDNGSKDQTKAVVESFSKHLQMKYLFEPRSGKCAALNCALDRGGLGEIIVFTDDDVDVPPDWLASIRSVCDRWPEHSVFGGRINVIFPKENIPNWAFDPYISQLAFAAHHYSNQECVYEGSDVPFGPNYWVRGKVFDNGRRFDETIGPHPTNRMLGDETAFLLDLLHDGYRIVHSPMVIVSHRIQPKILHLPSIYRRAYDSGRGEAHILGLPHPTLLGQNPAAWRMYRYGSIIFFSFKVLTSFIFSSKSQRPLNGAKSLRGLGYRVEVIRLANQALTQLRQRS